MTKTIRRMINQLAHRRAQEYEVSERSRLKADATRQPDAEVRLRDLLAKIECSTVDGD